MSDVRPTLSGAAFRVSILGTDQVEAYPNVHAEIDGTAGMVHVFSADRQLHYLSIPVQRALVEWVDPAALQPELRLPPIGPGGFARLGEQMQQFVEGFGKGFGPQG